MILGNVLKLYDSLLDRFGQEIKTLNLPKLFLMLIEILKLMSWCLEGSRIGEGLSIFWMCPSLFRVAVCSIKLTISS